MKSLVLFKNNLRINDNPLLYFSSKEDTILPAYIYDDINIRALGAASKYWLHKSLESLNKDLENRMIFVFGDTLIKLPALVKKYSINKVYLEKPYIHEEIKLYVKLEQILNESGVELISYNCSLLWEPQSILKADKSPYKVFTPFYKKGCLTSTSPEPPLGKPQKINYLDFENNSSLTDLKLLDNIGWHRKLDNQWEITEKNAHKIFHDFITNKVMNYKKERDYPYLEKNSRLSPFIRFGMISIHRMWNELNSLNFDKSIEHYKSELGWREFSYYLLHHFPYMSTQNFQRKFDNFNWENSNEKLNAWQKGNTGYPIIDAGMRELWETGFIHNRIRMVVGSFLVKNLLIDWRIGEKWFWDCLVDADYASNIASWQWVAGTGADAAPYFRIFNPMLQGKKFDEKGYYTTKYVPELKEAPIEILQNPWETDNKFNYPDPIIDYKLSRENALKKYQEIK